jgi:lipoprotein NlpD
VFSAAPGKVVYSGTGLRGYGKLLIVKHNEDFLSVYAHNSQLLTSEGQYIAQGQQIAISGGEGYSDVLHFEVRLKGKPVDPLKYLPKR